LRLSGEVTQTGEKVMETIWIEFVVRMIVLVLTGGMAGG
jgi:hypothetical protein